MFEDDPDVGVLDPPDDGPPPWAEIGFDAWLERLIEADPDRPREAALLVAEAEHAPVTPGLIDELAAVDPAELDESGRVGLAIAWARVENHAAARKLAAVAAVASPVPREDVARAECECAWAEVGAALRLGDGEASTLVETARQMSARLGASLAAMARGDLSWRKARSLAEHTLTLTDEQCVWVESRVLGRAVTRTPAQHDAAVRRAVDAIDPDAADRRRRQARRDIALIRAHHGDGMGEVYARMTSEEVEVVWLGADAWARRAKVAGDTRTLDQLRVAALVDWAEAFLLTGAPVTMPDPAELPTPPVDPDTGETASLILDPATGELRDADPPPGTEPGRDHPPTRHHRPLTST